MTTRAKADDSLDIRVHRQVVAELEDVGESQEWVNPEAVGTLPRPAWRVPCRLRKERRCHRGSDQRSSASVPSGTTPGCVVKQVHQVVRPPTSLAMACRSIPLRPITTSSLRLSSSASPGPVIVAFDTWSHALDDVTHGFAGNMEKPLDAQDVMMLNRPDERSFQGIRIRDAAKRDGETREVVVIVIVVLPVMVGGTVGKIVLGGSADAEHGQGIDSPFAMPQSPWFRVCGACVHGLAHLVQP